MWVGFAAYLGALALAPRLDRRLAWAAIVALVILFACLPPLLSHDVYSYVDYARLAVRHGLNPYVHAPQSAPGDPAFPHVTWTETTSAYGPLFTLATYPLAWLPVSAAVHLLKAISAAAVLAIAYLVARLAPSRGIDPARAAAFVALNPLVLVHVVGGPHNDGIAVLLMTLGIAGMLTAREGLGAGAFVSAAATKATAAIAIPFALLGSARRPRFLLGGLAALVLLVLSSYLAFGWSWLHAFAIAGENQGRTSHMSLPITMARLTGLDPDRVRAAFLILYAVLIAHLLTWTYKGGNWLRATAWATTGVLLATAWLLPWYLLWPLPAAALSRDRALQALLLALTAYQLGARIPL
jgi:alpha-1,6-mannosyltransferase